MKIKAFVFSVFSLVAISGILSAQTIPKDELPNLKKYRPLLGVTDLWLFSQILGKHERSAIFALQAKSAEKLRQPNEPAIYFLEAILMANFPSKLSPP